MFETLDVRLDGVFLLADIAASAAPHSAKRKRNQQAARQMLEKVQRNMPKWKLTEAHRHQLHIGIRRSTSKLMQLGETFDAEANLLNK